MPAEFTEMLLIGSDDYWGHAGSFDASINFYPHTFILSRAAYEGLENDSDRSRFFPCALFYYVGETDNHGFTPDRIGVMVDDDTANVGRVQGLDRMGNRERRTYSVGGATGYSIPGTSFTMMEAPDLNTFAAIEEAANDDELTVPGEFNVTDLRFNVDEVVNAINQTAGIETSEAETIGPAEVIPVNPEDYTPMTGPSPEEISAAESHEAVEYMSEGTYTHTTGNYTQDSSQAGYGVPEYYGSGSAGETRMEYDEMNSEWNDYVGKRVAHEMRGYYRTGVVGNPPIFAGKKRQTIARMSDADKRKYYEEAGRKSDSGWSKGPNRWQAMKVAKGVAMNEASSKGLSRHDAEEGFGPYEPDFDATPTAPSTEPPVGTGYETVDEGVFTETMLAEGYGAPDGALPPVMEEVSGETYLQGWGQGDIVGNIIANYDGTPFGFRAEEFENPMVDEGYYPNSYGDSSAVMSGRGVPQWVGSAETFEALGEPDAEYDQGYDDELDESLGMRDGAESTKSQSYKDRRDESKGMEKAMGRRAYSGVGTMDERNTVLEAEYFEAEGEFTRSDLISMVDEIRSMIDELDEDEMDDLDDIYQELMELEDQLESYMEEAYAAEGLGDYTGPLDNGMGEGSAAGSGHGVAQWYGSAETFEALGNPNAPYDQGYDDQLDESLGMRHRGPHSQNLKDRRDESKGMEKSMGHRPYSSVDTMDAEGSSILNLNTAAIGVGAVVVGALVAHFFSKKGETESVPEENGSVKENKGDGN